MISLGPYIERARAARGPTPVGRVHDVVGMLVEVVGVTAATGDRLEIELGHSPPLVIEVLGFRSGRLLCAPLGPTAGVEPGAAVRRSQNGATIPVGDGVLGRIIDSFGRPLDNLPPPASPHRAKLYRSPPPSFGRKPISERFESGVRVIDAMLPLGRGQRVGLFAGTGVGKSTLLGMMCRRAQADVVVVGLIGERGREVGDFVRHALGPGLSRSVVVAATSDSAPLVRVQGALAATAIAEHFRDRGASVLLVMDSVTRFAMAMREASLAAGEPPVTKGYTPSVFAALPTLLERPGNDAGSGSITAIYTVLVEGDDLNDPIADAVRGILDGHIVLSRAMGERGVYPSIDVLKSVSRVQNDVARPEQLKVAQDARGMLGTYREVADLVKIGAYVAGSDAKVDQAISATPRIENFIRQGLDEPSTSEEAVRGLAQALAPPRMSHPSLTRGVK